MENENENIEEEKTEEETKLMERVRKKGYKIEQISITYDNIDEFKMIPNRRQISDCHVKKIHGAFLEGKNPVGVLIVNLRGRDMRLIDGNHRVEAIKRFYKYKDAHKKIKIDCVLKVYKELNDDEERQVYSDEAKRRNESYEDRLNIYKDTITFWKLLNDPINKFPCSVSIYPAKEGIKFRHILNAFNTSKKSSAGYYSSYLNKEDLVEFAKTLEYDDYVLLKGFMEFFIETFGKVGKENMFCKVQFLLPLFDIYVKNVEYKNDANFKERFKRILGRSDLLTYTNLAGREAQSRIRNLMIGYMNHYISKNMFK